MKSLTTSLSILVVSPDDSLRNLLAVLLKSMHFGKVATANTSPQAREICRNGLPDVCIIDTSSPKVAKSGLALAEELGKKNSEQAFIFVVSSTTDAVYRKTVAFAGGGAVSRDVSQGQLYRVLRAAELQLENANLKQRVHQRDFTSGSPRGNRTPEKPLQLFFKIGDSYRRIDEKKISYFFAKNKMTYARVGNRNFPTSVQLKTLQEQLSSRFIRCHKTYIVNVAAIDSISLKESRVSVGEDNLPIGYSYRKSFVDSLNLLR